jgi:threonine/homoserine/homoserine lactone efflux protein
VRPHERFEVLTRQCRQANACGVAEHATSLREVSVDTSFVAFLAISAVVIVTPGQDTALTIRNTLVGGRRAGTATAIGVAGGQLVWTIAASAGITALLVASEPVFTAVRLAGALYLVYLGGSTLWDAWHGTTKAGHEPRAAGSSATGTAERSFRQGLLSNLGNPKMVIFFSSLLPQFAPAVGPTFAGMLGLGVMFCTMTLVWLAAYAWLIARVGVVLRRTGIRRLLDTIAGVILIALGLRLATEPALVDR